MFRPEAYKTFKRLPFSSTKAMFDKYFELISLRKDGTDRILDIGCCDGGTTIDLVLNRFPGDRATIVGIDRADEMVDYARKGHGKNKRATFRKCDIETRDLPQDLLGQFDHAFALFLMNWIKDERLMLENTNKLLKPGGDFFTTFFGKHTVFTAMEKLKATKWGPYMKEAPLSIYQTMERPERHLNASLVKAGFTVPLCIEVERTFTCDIDEYRNLAMAVHPTLRHLPESEWSAYIDDALEEYYKTGNVKNVNGTITDNFTLLVAVGRKSPS